MAARPGSLGIYSKISINNKCIRCTKTTGKRARRKNQIIRNPAYPYSLANIDRRIVGEPAGLEIKTCSPFRLPDFKGDEYPPEFLAQCLHYLAVTGWERWYLAVFEVAIQDSKMTLFGRQRATLAEVGINLDSIVETYKYFTEMQTEDPELKIPTYRVKIPAGGSRAFDIVTGAPEFDITVKSFRGIVANFHNCNALFPSAEPSNDPPVCSSSDGFKELDLMSNEIKDCADCPNNQWGSGNGSKRGKACKNMRRLYILVEGSDIPVVMTLPPTSIAGWEKYKSAVLGVQRLTPKEVVTEFSLGVMVNGRRLIRG